MQWIRKREKIGKYILSIQRSDHHYCTSTTYEIAIILEGSGCIVPRGMERFYTVDTVIGWVTEEKLEEIKQALRDLAAHELN